MSVIPIRQKWKSEMTDRERFNNQMHYREVDRSFNMEFGYWTENFTQWAVFKDNKITNNEEADILFGFDRFAGCGGNIWMSPTFTQVTVSETENYYVVRNADGLLAEMPKTGKSSIPHYLKSSVVTPDDWMAVKKERFNVDDPARKINTEHFRHIARDDRDYPLMIYCGSMIGKIRDMLTFEGLCYACYDYPEMVEDMVETACRLVENFLDQALPLGTYDGASGWEDICFKNGPIVSVPFFREIITPRYKRIRNKLDNYGIDIWYTDCDGDVRPVMPCFMDGGINCLFPFEVNSCAHPSELFDTYGRELRIMGGVDKMALGAGRDAIDDYMESLIPLVKRGGYIPFCDHRCPPNVPQEDYLYYLDLKESLFGMK